MLVLLFGAVSVLIPVRAEAAYSESYNSGVEYSKDEIKDIVKASYGYTFNDASEMLKYELEKGYLSSVTSDGGRFSLYVNKYIGTLYYVNNATGEILTSNPYNAGTIKSSSEKVASELMSQVVLSFIDLANASASPTYHSAEWSAQHGQISVSNISGGMRVDYTLGDTSMRFLLPGQITAEKFENNIFIPMLNYYKEQLEKYCSEVDTDVSFDLFAEAEYKGKEVYVNGCLSKTVINLYLSETKKVYDKLKKGSVGYQSLNTIHNNIMEFYTTYRLCNPVGASEQQLEGFYKICELTKEGIAVYACQIENVTQQRKRSNILRLYAPDYTFKDMYADEAECMYTPDSKEKPVFRCSLEYTFNDDGSLSVRLPANSISFDESVYTFKNIVALPYFGAGDINEYGYVFVPDGSGSVIEYEDFKSLTLNLSVYGHDYCYSKISGKHREQVSMPVYGMVSTFNASSETKALTGCGDKITSGYFAIMEEGASLGNIIVSFKGSDHSFSSTYAQYTPYPSDEYDLTNTISVGVKGSYTMVSESKYTGSYVTRYVMLSELDETACKPDYNGMAAYYRNYLKDTGVLSSLEEVEETLPLYIEALGSMEAMDSFLTFPVKVDVALTTFDDLVEMYKRLSDAKTAFIAEAERYAALAEAEVEDVTRKAEYEARAKRYEELAEEVINITNVNFKLTGFANDGLYSTYPVRVRWERCLGGKKGVRELLSTVADINATEGNSLGIYPEFDFQYINHTTLFDGIGKRNNVSRMVDNRYASKQVYNSVSGEFESLFALIISADALDRLYSKFEKKYSKYDFEGISVSTLGSDLNSNFDEDNPVNRDQSQAYVEALLDRMASKYSVMLDRGNIYSVKYADHIVGMCIDSSRFTYSSYNVPFVGLVLHSYVNYAGSEMNYSGTPAYEMLHAIENGAALYYTLAYSNTELMKDDEILNKYFGVSFDNWYFSLVEQYSELNAAIGDLQSYEIYEHRTLLAERVLDDKERFANEKLLKDEFLALVEGQIIKAVSDAFGSMAGNPDNFGKGVRLTVDTASLLAQASELFNIDIAELRESDFDDRLEALAKEYTERYKGTAESAVASVELLDYASAHDFVTDSFATDADYDKTDYTVDNHLVTMVTYRDAATGREVSFVLNYNIYAVEVVLDADTTIVLEPHGYERLD